MKYLVVFVLAVSLCASLAFASGKMPDKVPIQNLPVISGNETLEVAPTTVERTAPWSPPSTDYLGEIDTVGYTWYDYQHNGTAGRMIRYDASGKIHVAWMRGYGPGLTEPRHIFYNMLDPATGWVWPQIGTNVENATKGGYTSLGVNADGYPFPCFHVLTPSSPLQDNHSAVAADFFPGTGAFQFWELPYVYAPDALEVIWPKIAVDIQGRLHIVGTENPASGVAGDPQRVYYCRGTFDPIGFNITYQPQQLIEWTENITADITASRHSDRVALAYTKIRYYPPVEIDTTQYNNDVYLFISEDGVTWDFTHPNFNVTNFIPPDPSLLPDSLAADRDTLRVYNDISLLFDEDDNVHAAFTTPAYYAYEGLISVSNALIWHWNEATQNYGLIVNEWYDFGINCGAWQRIVQRPNLAIDTATRNLYCTYQKYDTNDVSSGGWLQGEVMVTWSDDNGEHWAQATNVSDTHAPGAEPGHCFSERDITVNETVEDGALHILYVEDTDAGGIPQSEGAWTNSPVYYHEVSVSDIAHSPMIHEHPMHVDGTGLPGPYVNVPEAQGGQLPSSFSLSQNYPNPFNPTTNIRFDLTSTDKVSLKVYNITGQEVATLVSGTLVAGSYSVPFNATDLASGVYFYKLSTSTQTETRKMVLLK